MCDCRECQLAALRDIGSRHAVRCRYDGLRRGSSTAKILSIREAKMLSAKDALKKGGQGGILLKGSLTPMKMKQFDVKVIGVRPAPESFNTAVILDIEEIFGATSWAPNKTCLKLLAATLSSDNLEELEGATIKLMLTMARNPKASNALVRSLIVGGVKLKRARKMTDVVPPDDDVPF